MSSYSFEDLEVYKAAREFRKNIFGLIKNLPPEEKHNCGSQMRRAATSLTNNIAEGHDLLHRVNGYIAYLRTRKSLESRS